MFKLAILTLKLFACYIVFGDICSAAVSMKEVLASSSLLLMSTESAKITLGQLKESNMPSSSEITGDGDPIGAVNIQSVPKFEADENFSSSSPVIEVCPCNLNVSNKDSCIAELIQKIAPKLKQNKIAEYGLNSIDPYFYRRGIFRYANNGIQGGLLIKNMNIHGISAIKVNNVLSNFTKNEFILKLDVELPGLKANGQFKADVKFGGLRLVPKGPFNITIEHIRATIIADGVIERVKDSQRLQLNRLNANVAIGDAHIIANGIFSDGNLNTMILNLINENLSEITRVGVPATREQWAPILVAHINEFFANVPIEKFLLQ